MLKQSLWAAGCLGFGLLLGALMADLVRVRPSVSPRLPELGPELAALPEAAPESEAAQAPAPPPEAAPEPDPERAWISAEANELVDRFMAGPWPELDASAWSRQYASEARFLVDGTDGEEWITVSSARVPCERVDALLARHRDAELGTPDRCDRWRRAAVETMRSHGIEDKTPEEFLDELEADRSVRVMLVYAGWSRVPGADNEIQLVDARPAFLYPRTQFKQQNIEAQSAILRVMKLGPYAEESVQELSAAKPGH